MTNKSNHTVPNISRRGFLQLGSAALAAAGIGARAAVGSEPGAATSSATLRGKIALEEHFDFADTAAASYAAPGSPDFQRQIEEIGARRISEMDRGGVEICILSLVGTGIQAIPDTRQAIAVARRANDHLASRIAENPKRFRGFAALPMQDAQAAAQELTRCVKELKFCGALVNGYSNNADGDSILFYDLPQYRDFWATVQHLGVPFYLHPRSAPTHAPAYEGHFWLTGSIWGFASETAIHALRLMGSGLFDEYPKLKLILGHLGESLPCNMWRIDNRITRTLAAHPKAKLPMSHYLRENFYITTSGNFRTQTLTEVMLEVGADRILYSVDYPFEDMSIASDWFDRAAISESDRLRIGMGNARQLFAL